MRALTGIELYEVYKRAHLEQGCSVDEWEDLDESEKDVWRRMAVMLMDA